MAGSAVLDNRKGSRRLITCYLEDARRANEARADARGESTGGSASASAAPVETDEQRLRRLIEPHLFYVLQVVGEFRVRDVPFEELLAEGNIGLVEAARRYDASHETKFLTYASWWIRKRILDYLAREARCVRLTRYARDRRRALRAVEERLRAELGREPSTEEIAAASGLKVRAVREIAAGNVRVFSIDQNKRNETGTTLAESLPDERATSPLEEMEQRSVRERVHRELDRLPERERFVLASRFGLDGRQPLTFEEIGRTFGVSRERARQIEQEALRKLRRRMAASDARKAAPPAR